MSILVTPILVPQLNSLQDVRQVLSQKLQELQVAFNQAAPTTNFAGSRVTNIGTPQQPGDAVNLGYLLGVLPTAVAATSNPLAGLVWNGGSLIVSGNEQVNGTVTATSFVATGTGTSTFSGAVQVGTLTSTGRATFGTLSSTGLGVFGTLSSPGPFGVNGASPQPAAASGGALALTSTNVAPFGFASAADFNAMQSLINTIRAALVADGIMS